jgi:uncharacterized membrane protein YkvA (DUF1232 family)
MQKQSNVPKLSVLQALGERLATGWRLFVDSRVPLWAKALPVGALVYVLWPMDILADVIPGLGQLDDLTIMVLAIEAFIRLCPEDLWAKTEASGRDTPADTVEGSYRFMDDKGPPETTDTHQIGGGLSD